MDIKSDRDAKLLREKVRSVLFLIGVAGATSTLRIAIWAASMITLWYTYGPATVSRQHLRITRMRPELLVSNGDVLWGRSFYHYLISVGIWLPLACGVLLLIYYKFVPKRVRDLYELSQRTEGSIWPIAQIWGIVLFFLVGLLPAAPALAVAAVSVVVALLWARRIGEGLRVPLN